MRERSTLWIHSQVKSNAKTQKIREIECILTRTISLLQIKACMEPVDCQPDFCLDLFEPSGHGRRRRAIFQQTNKNSTNSITDFTKFKENIEYSVSLPGEYDSLRYQDPDQCKNFVLISGLLALLLTLSTILVNILNLLVKCNNFGINMEY